MAAEDEAGVEKEKGGEKEVDFGAGQNKGNQAIANGAENGTGFDGKINFGRRRRANRHPLFRILHRRGLEVDEVIAVKGI